MATTMFIGSGRRSGTRGGQDQFTWDQVKNDKYKEFYLGHSLHTTEKPTFNNRKPNPLWYNKKTGSAADQARDEIAAIKEQEEQLMREALGLAPRRKLQSGKGLDSGELKELTKRGNTERDGILETDRIEGLGYAPHIVHPGQEGVKAMNIIKTEEGLEGQPQGILRISGNAQPNEQDEGEWEERVVQESSSSSRRREKRDKKEKKKDKKDKKKKKQHKEKRREERKKRKRDNEESDRDRNRDRDRERDRDRDRGERKSDESSERRRDKDRHRQDREEDKERDRRDRDRDRDREHRDRGRDRDRDREHKDREDKEDSSSHRHKRRRHDSESP